MLAAARAVVLTSAIRTLVKTMFFPEVGLLVHKKAPATVQINGNEALLRPREVIGSSPGSIDITLSSADHLPSLGGHIHRA